MEIGGTPFAPRTLLSLGGTPFPRLCLLGVPLRGRRVFRGTFAFVFGFAVLLRRRYGVGVGFLAVSGDLTAKPLAPAFALAPPVLDRSTGCDQRDHDHDGDNDGDHGDR